MKLEGYDWEAVFEFTSGGQAQGPNGRHSYEAGKVSACEGDAECSTTPFGLNDVDLVIASANGENDGGPWLCVVRLKDGRYAFASAWCDYTGWDCQSGGYGIVARNLDHLVRFGLGDADRERLGL